MLSNGISRLHVGNASGKRKLICISSLTQEKINITLEGVMNTNKFKEIQNI